MQQHTMTLLLLFLVGFARTNTIGALQDNQQLGSNVTGDWEGEDGPTTPSSNSTDTNNGTLSLDDSVALSQRYMAIQFVLDKVLRALGPKFQDRLPTAPTSASLTPLSSTLSVETERCPERYRRCSSETFYPSCEIPRNTDAQIWEQRFGLFFNISAELSSVHRNDILNATLRLYKNMPLPLTTPKSLTVTVHAFYRSLRRNRERSVAVASTRVSSDFVGWLYMDVERLVRRLKGKSNYGVKISVLTEENHPWNIPDLFVRMDCQASNESLIPLPFEVELDDNTQRYPALNIRSGTPYRRRLHTHPRRRNRVHHHNSRTHNSDQLYDLYDEEHRSNNMAHHNPHSQYGEQNRESNMAPHHHGSDSSSGFYGDVHRENNLIPHTDTHSRSRNYGGENRESHRVIHDSDSYPFSRSYGNENRETDQIIAHHVYSDSSSRYYSDESNGRNIASHDPDNDSSSNHYDEEARESYRRPQNPNSGASSGYYGAHVGNDRYEPDDSYVDEPSPNIWSTDSPSNDQAFHQPPVSRHQSHYKKQSPVFPMQHNTGHSQFHSPIAQYYDQGQHQEENRNDESRQYSEEFQNSESRHVNHRSSSLNSRQEHQYSDDIGYASKEMNINQKRVINRENHRNRDARPVHDDVENHIYDNTNADYSNQNINDYNSNMDYYSDYSSSHEKNRHNAIKANNRNVHERYHNRRHKNRPASLWGSTSTPSHHD